MDSELKKLLIEYWKEIDLDYPLEEISNLYSDSGFEEYSRLRKKYNIINDLLLDFINSLNGSNIDEELKFRMSCSLGRVLDIWKNI